MYARARRKKKKEKVFLYFAPFLLSSLEDVWPTHGVYSYSFYVEFQGVLALFVVLSAQEKKSFFCLLSSIFIFCSVECTVGRLTD